MQSKIDQKTRQCCARERKRLMDQLDACERRSKTQDERHRCYRIAARASGHRTKRCAFGG